MAAAYSSDPRFPNARSPHHPPLSYGVFTLAAQRNPI